MSRLLHLFVPTIMASLRRLLPRASPHAFPRPARRSITTSIPLQQTQTPEAGIANGNGIHWQTPVTMNNPTRTPPLNPDNNPPYPQTPLRVPDESRLGNPIFDKFDLSGGVCLVTGARQGLGLAMAEGLAEAGGRVYCFDLTPSPGAAFEKNEA